MKRLASVVGDPAEPRVRLRLATADDREPLRVWKNQNKAGFFHQEDITPEQQARWFAGYLERDDDHMYLVEEREREAWTTVGVLGCRRLEDILDIYNVMRVRDGRGIAQMGRALRLLCEAAQAAYRLPIRCEVLNDNPALDWYQRNGFVVRETKERSKILELTA